MKTTQEIKSLIKEIVQLAMVISEETEHDVFVEYSPHVNWLSYRVFENGWSKGREPARMGDIYLDSENLTKELIDLGVYLADFSGAELSPCTQA